LPHTCLEATLRRPRRGGGLSFCAMKISNADHHQRGNDQSTHTPLVGVVFTRPPL
jgi:hypothetical protein